MYANPAYKSLNGLYVVLFSNSNGSVITCDKLAGYDALNTVRVKNGKVYLCEYNGNEEHTVQFTPIDNQDNKFKIISTYSDTLGVVDFADVAEVKTKLATWINAQEITIGAVEIPVFEVVNSAESTEKYTFILSDKGKGLLAGIEAGDLFAVGQSAGGGDGVLQLAISKQGFNGELSPVVYPVDRQRTVIGYKLGSNATDFSVTINSVNYTKADVTNVVVPVNTEIKINDVTILTGNDTGNVVLILK